MPTENNADDNSRPLVSFILLAYNQEGFIREAVEGAFAQTYTPLEIILSDDCSHDQTFSIMQDMVSAYSGPHRIILNKNQKNLGIGAHVNRCVELSSGVLLVMAAGDDISFQNRVEVIYKYWKGYNKPSLVLSNVHFIDEKGNVTDQKYFNPDKMIKDFYFEHPEEQYLIDKLWNNEKYLCIGASEAFDPNIFNKFGPLPNNVIAEDMVLIIRAYLDSGVLYLPEKLVKYRVHENSCSFSDIKFHCYKKNGKGYKNFYKNEIFNRDLKKSYLKNIWNVIDAWNIDFRTALGKNLIDKDQYNRLADNVNGRKKVLYCLSNWWKYNLIKRIQLYNKVIKIWGKETEIKWSKKRIFGILYLFLMTKLKSFVTIQRKSEKSKKKT